jgi:hypothetical protein
MSKKLIAVASAAALALAGLVAVPTVATADVGAFNVVADGASTNHVSRDGTTAAKSIQVNVPSANVLRNVTSSLANLTTTSTAVKLTITTPGATDAITVSTTGGVLVMTDTTFDAATAPTVASGTTTLTDVAANGDAVIYAITTSTAVGTVVVSAAGSSKTINISGLSDFAYKLKFTAPATAALGGDIVMTGTAVDAFGNNLTTPLTWGSFDFTQVGATAPANSTLGFSRNATTNVYSITWTAPTTAQGTAIQATLKAANTSTAVDASGSFFGTRVNTAFATVNAVDLAAQVTALTAQVAALTADYNALAAKWNKRVASKKAPKKAVATK